MSTSYHEPQPIQIIRTIGAAPGPETRPGFLRHILLVFGGAGIKAYHIDADAASRMMAMRAAEEQLTCVLAAGGRVAGSDLPVSRDLLGGGHSWTLTEWEARWEDEENAAAIRAQAAAGDSQLSDEWEVAAA